MTVQRPLPTARPQQRHTNVKQDATEHTLRRRGCGTD